MTKTKTLFSVLLSAALLIMALISVTPPRQREPLT